MNGSPKLKIVLTGPESSGKTTLANLLADYYKTVPVGEFAREYIAQHGLDYTPADILDIAREQDRQIREAIGERDVVIVDTAYLELKVWNQVKFDRKDDFIDSNFASFSPDLYLLCKPDFEWQYDPVRESETMREELYYIYKCNLEMSMKPFVVLVGGIEKRISEALRILSLL